MLLDRLILETASGSHAIGVEVAVTLARQQTGLKFLEHLPDDTGMLFLYRPPREVAMWMKDTLVPLDMVFVRSGGTVHRIEAGATPLSQAIIPSLGPVAAVLEVAAGTADRFGLRVGDRVLHPALAADAPGAR